MRTFSIYVVINTDGSTKSISALINADGILENPSGIMLNRNMMTEEEIATIRSGKGPQKSIREYAREHPDHCFRLGTLPDGREVVTNDEWEQRRIAKTGLKLEIIKRGMQQGEELDPYAIVEISDPQTNESLRFKCTNIFDFGYTINPMYSIASGHEPGGLEMNGFWNDYKSGSGWQPVRELSSFEKRALQLLRDFPPVRTGIRL